MGLIGHLVYIGDKYGLLVKSARLRGETRSTQDKKISLTHFARLNMIVIWVVLIGLIS